jgi:hypothetical protein
MAQWANWLSVSFQLASGGATPGAARGDGEGGDGQGQAAEQGGGFEWKESKRL